MAGQAVVLGASMSGLLAARVLADHFDTVAVVERDVLPDGTDQRRGVPQGRHVHGLLCAGASALDALFPGFLDELAADGATRLDERGAHRLSMMFGGHPLHFPMSFTRPLVSYLCSRPFLETHVRQRVRSTGNIQILDGHDVADMTMSGDGRRVSGVRIADRAGGAEQTLDADLVVDATGRSARTPAFLERHGYPRPVEERIAIQVAYSSQLLRIPRDAVEQRLFLIAPAPELAAAAALFAYENDTWMFTAVGLTGNDPPTDPDGMRAFVAPFAPQALRAALDAAQPLSQVSGYRYPASVRRRYDRIRRFPLGLLVTGDAICSFNPAYGQGMSVAALEALILRDCLESGTRDLHRRFQHSAAKLLDRVWQMAAGADLTFPQVEGPRPVSIRLNNWYTDRVLTAAESDTTVSEAFFRVMNLVDPPTRLLRPSVRARSIAARSHRAPATATGQLSAAPGVTSDR